jgi:hypothetical protein
MNETLLNRVHREIQNIAEKAHQMFGPEVGREITKAVDEAKANVAPALSAADDAANDAAEKAVFAKPNPTDPQTPEGGDGGTEV